ncbi:MAG: type II toxin-antitoxin system mRNA interferase toxin, RelE/StbE family, partial [Bacteroides sp.]
PHPLKGNWAGLWAIRVTQMIRIVYQIHDKRLVVEVISMRGHYEGLKKR